MQRRRHTHYLLQPVPGLRVLPSIIGTTDIDRPSPAIALHRYLNRAGQLTLQKNFDAHPPIRMSRTSSINQD